MPLGIFAPPLAASGGGGAQTNQVQTSPVNGTGAPTVVGQVGYIDSAGKFQTADNGSALAAAARVIAIAVAANGAAVLCVSAGIVTGLSGLTPGGDVFLGVAGALTQTAPTAGGKFITNLGCALSATSMSFAPQPYTGPL